MEKEETHDHTYSYKQPVQYMQGGTMMSGGYPQVYSSGSGYTMMPTQHEHNEQQFVDSHGNMPTHTFMPHSGYEMGGDYQQQPDYLMGYQVQNSGVYSGGFQPPGMAYAGSHGMINPAFSVATAPVSAPTPVVTKTERPKKWCGMC